MKKQVQVGGTVQSATKNRGKGVEDGSETSNDGLHTGAPRNHNLDHIPTRWRPVYETSEDITESHPLDLKLIFTL